MRLFAVLNISIELITTETKLKGHEFHRFCDIQTIMGFTGQERSPSAAIKHKHEVLPN